MRSAYSAFILLTAVFLFSCNSTKKTTAATNTAAGEGNPTLKKPNYTRIDNQTFLLEGIATDKTYGYSAENAVKVGIADNGNSGPANERSYLNALLGPEGQAVKYTRLGGCCPVKSENGFMGTAMLDRYEVTYNGLEKPVIIYINMYDPGRLYAPAGFTFKKN